MTRASGSARAWRLRLDDCDKAALAKAPPFAYKVFRAIVRRAGVDGYAWPKVETIQAETGIRKRRMVCRAIKELEHLHVLFHHQLADRKTGRIATSLYRVGAKVESIPARCRMDVVLTFRSPTPKRKSASPCAPKGYMAPCALSWHRDSAPKGHTELF